MIARLNISGPDAFALTNYFTERYGWVFFDVEQVTTMKGVAMGWHPSAEEFEGIGISDGTYVQSIEFQLEGSGDEQGLPE